MTRNAPLVLVVEDEAPVRRFVRAALEVAGYRVVEAESAREATAHAAGWRPDLVVLDLGLPDGDGLEVLQVLRDSLRIPIIVVSARGQEATKVAALDAGADDYLTKPFGVPELLARLRVAMRRGLGVVRSGPDAIWRAADVTLDLARRVVTRSGTAVHLTPTEFRLLALLAQHAGGVVTHQQLLEEGWGPAALEQPHYLRVYMSQLRRKLETDPARPRLLLTEPGVGYRLVESDDGGLTS
ncbi:MAG: response regulator [Gemmatimonadales bacterium]|nr:response regulator [Gemmatimonadales bacterium]